jgi:uncharacterized protein
MKIPEKGKLLRIFIGESDKYKGKPLYEHIIFLAKDNGMAGATAIKGFQGFGSKSHMHTTSLLRLSEDLPVIVEIADREKRIEQFLNCIDKVITDGLVTLEDIDLIMYRAS